MTRTLPAPNHTQNPNKFFDDWLPEITHLSELKVVLAVIRATFGWHEPSAKLSLSDFEERTGLTRPSVIEGIQLAMSDGYIGREKDGQSYLYFCEVEGSKANLPAGQTEQKKDLTSTGKQSYPVAGKANLPDSKDKETRKKKPSNKGSLSAASQAAEEVITQAWDFWSKYFCDCFDTQNYSLTKKVRGMIRARIFGELKFEKLEQFEQACRGLRLSKHHMGGNKDGVFYLQPKYVWGDDEKMQENIARYRESLKTSASAASQSNQSGPRRICKACNDTGDIIKPAQAPASLTEVPTQFWSKLLTDLGQQLGAGTVATWFSKLSCAGVSAVKVYIRAPSPQVTEWITKHHAEAFATQLEIAFGKSFEIEWLLPVIEKCKHDQKAAA
jgi:hypothetical protein